MPTARCPTPHLLPCQAGEAATTQMACINVSAFNIFPPPDPEMLTAQVGGMGRSKRLGMCAMCVYFLRAHG